MEDDSIVRNGSGPSGGDQTEPDLRPQTEIDYLTRDYDSFRQLILDHLTALVPKWQERHAADVGVALAELLAYAADNLSYRQDAVATESYLGTARQRISVRRHARLMDYRVSEGCNSRVWAHVKVNADRTSLPARTQFLAAIPKQGVRLTRDALEIYDGPVFETMHEAVLFRDQNCMRIDTYGRCDFRLDAGATEARLIGRHRHLKTGDVLIFEEVSERSYETAADSDRNRRTAVRLRETPEIVTRNESGQEATIVRWRDGDALPFDLRVAVRLDDGRQLRDLCVARGNIVLADSGTTISDEELPPVPWTSLYAPTLNHVGLVWSQLADNLAHRPAREALEQDPRLALPAIQLHEHVIDTQEADPSAEICGRPLIALGSLQWQPRPDLLGSDRFARSFVAEIDNTGRTHLRFGNGVLGRRPQPTSGFRAQYRIGNGTAGNIGPETLTHVVTDDERIVGVRNPLPARGGTDPESMGEVRLNAPQAFRIQKRCVTEHDYSLMASHFPGISQARAIRSWNDTDASVVVFVAREGQLEVNKAFANEVFDYLEPFGMIGDDLRVVGAHYVSVFITLHIEILPGWHRADVLRALTENFGNRHSTDFFAPSSFEFGQSLNASQLLAHAMKVPGIAAVDLEYFGKLPGQRCSAGEILVEPFEIIRLNNDPRRPREGRIVFRVEEGL